MPKYVTSAFLFCIAITLFSRCAFASIITFADNNSVFQDSETGLYWYNDPYVFQKKDKDQNGVQENEILTLVQAFYQISGMWQWSDWRLASQNEIQELQQNTDTIDGSSTPPYNGDLFMGWKSDGSEMDYIKGFTTSSPNKLGEDVIIKRQGKDWKINNYITFDTDDPDYTSGLIGVFMVSTNAIAVNTVPEPSSVFLFLAGIAILAKRYKYSEELKS